MKKIRIIATPPGFAPEEIRKDWVGLEIQANEQVIETTMKKVGIWSGNSNAGGYLVLNSDALDALEAAGKTDAFGYWNQISGQVLRFSQDVCELIEG